MANESNDTVTLATSDDHALFVLKPGVALLRPLDSKWGSGNSFHFFPKSFRITNVTDNSIVLQCATRLTVSYSSAGDVRLFVSGLEIVGSSASPDSATGAQGDTLSRMFDIPTKDCLGIETPAGVKVIYSNTSKVDIRTHINLSQLWEQLRETDATVGRRVSILEGPYPLDALGVLKAFDFKAVCDPTMELQDDVRPLPNPDSTAVVVHGVCTEGQCRGAFPAANLCAEEFSWTMPETKRPGAIWDAAFRGRPGEWTSKRPLVMRNLEVKLPKGINVDQGMCYLEFQSNDSSSAIVFTTCVSGARLLPHTQGGYSVTLKGDKKTRGDQSCVSKEDDQQDNLLHIDCGASVAKLATNQSPPPAPVVSLGSVGGPIIPVVNN